MKNCSKCGQEKALDQFHRHSQSKDGRRPDCKICFEAQHKRYRSNPEVKNRIHSYMKQYRDNRTAEQAQRWYESSRRSTAKTPRMALWVSRNNAYNRRPHEDFVRLDQLMEMWRAQEGSCAISGVTMTWQKGTIQPTSISLDRIDNDRGYTVDNVRLVCFCVNAFRNRMTDDEMFAMAVSIVTNMKRPRLRLVG